MAARASSRGAKGRAPIMSSCFVIIALEFTFPARVAGLRLIVSSQLVVGVTIDQRGRLIVRVVARVNVGR
eukprot:4861952-Lingulodinium_polyedra.AAC.1